MKKIFVTIAEFLENGGKIEEGRKLYEENDFGKFDYQFSIPDNYILSDIAKTWYHVEIHCTPHYV